MADLYERATDPGTMLLEDRARPKATKVPTALLGLMDAPIAFHRSLAGPLGGVLPALFMSQALYWTQRTGNSDGWFFKTREEWTAEVGLNRYEQEQARTALKKLGVLEENLKGLPAKMHYRVNLQKLAEILESTVNNRPESPPTSRATLSQQEGRPSANIQYTESTSETTAEVAVEEISDDDLRGMVFAYNSGTPGTSWLCDMRIWLKELADEGFAVTRAHLKAAAKRGKEVAREQNKSPTFLEPLGVALAEVVRGVRQDEEEPETEEEAKDRRRWERQAKGRAIEQAAADELGYHALPEDSIEALRTRGLWSDEKETRHQAYLALRATKLRAVGFKA